MNIDISVVIVNWNGLQFLMECLESLCNFNPLRNMEIIVVDNASSDGSPDEVAIRFPGVILIRNMENFGFSKGNNIGIRASKGKYIYLLNSDIKVLDGCIDALADYMDVNPDTGIIGPKILNGDLSHQSSCRNFPTLWNNFCSAMGLASAFKHSKFFSGEHMFYFHGDRTLDVDALVGCFWAVRREALNDFGLLDEEFFIYSEDVDWCKRCWKAGWRVTFFPGAKAIHCIGASSKNDPVRFALAQQRSVHQYWRKHHTLAGRFGILCLTFMYLIIRWAAVSLVYVVQPAWREELKGRFHVIRSCLKALIADSSAQGNGA
jgi:GT2 family glycosyltransferase